MPQAEARAWWADVQHLREPADGRQEAARALTLVAEQEQGPLLDLHSGERSAAGMTVVLGVGAPSAPEPSAVVPDVPHRPLRPVPADETVAERRLRAARPRRTVQIQGRLDDPAQVASIRSASARRAGGPGLTGVGPRPDRIAMWAVVLGVFLLLVAALSSDSAHAATRLGERPLKVGMIGRDVRHLQLRLKHAGFLDAPATARFGAITRRGVKRYQRSRCLPADGVAGPATIRTLRSRAARCRRPTRTASSGGKGSERDRYLEVQLGTRTLARGMAGRDVRTVQRLLDVRITGRFGPVTETAVRAFQQGAGIGVDGAVGPGTRDALIERQMRPRTATYYGPGLYGKRTACGQRLTRRLHGVAHRTLPCGAAVTLFLDGRFVTTRVVDRGPFVKGITFDLTAATARELGTPGTVRLRAAY
jgi:peptidoglycan hydrolase-like protein with peptidoglycan-binding domain